MKTGKRTICLIIIAAALLIFSVWLLGNDSTVFLKWWLMAALFGIGYYPLAAGLFSGFEDKGFAFSKVLGIFLGGFLMWFLGASHLAAFTPVLSLICALLPAVLCWVLYYYHRKKEPDFSKKSSIPINIDLVLLEEIAFIAVFLIWTYVVAFKPEAHGTEKFMDYGFLASFMRCETLPAKDIWYSFNDLNYYYGGQYYTAFLAKLSGTSAAYAYNIMRTMIAGFAFVLPLSVVAHLISGIREGVHRNVLGPLPVIAGVIAGTAVTFAGNMHYVLYRMFGEVLKLPGYEDYFFPSPTRFIGHNPLIDNDQCIHEFPSYSFLLGDLHAHMVNIIFVLLCIGILVAWFRKKEAVSMREAELFEKKGAKFAVLSALTDPYVWILGVLTGIFRLNNYWDFAIYLTVTAIGSFLLFLKYSKKGLRTLYFLRWIVQMVLVVILGTLAALPFTLNFQTMQSGIGICQTHTAFYQLAVLWGLPVAAVAALFLFVVVKRKGGFFSSMKTSDMIALLLGICAIGLVLIPELVYVRDIYEENYARSNTMFKLTYQAFIMFGFAMPYAMIRLVSGTRKIIVRAVAFILLGLFVLTCGYFQDSVWLWFGDVTDRERYQGLDAEAFVWRDFPHDAGAIQWLIDNVDGSLPIVEANGNSYSDNALVSSMTGLPTILGWYVHEWLWRSDSEGVKNRAADVSALYNAQDPETLSIILSKYGIRYIYIGTNERAAFPNMNEILLQSAGHIVYDNVDDPESAYIIEVEQ